MRMGGPREAIWHAIIRKNYGCTHFIVGRDHAGPGKNKNGKDFYGPYDAQVLISKYVDELGVQVVPFQMVSYIPDRDEYIPSDQIPDGTQSLNISGTELRRMLRVRRKKRGKRNVLKEQTTMSSSTFNTFFLKTGSKIPDWFTYPEVQALLRQQSPPRKQQGITIYLTGFLNSGANTIARALQCALDQEGTRRTTLFLGESVQQAKEISMTAVDQQHVDFHSYKPPVERLADIETLAFCASQVSKNGGIAILTPLIGTAESRVVSKKIVDEECAGVGGYYVIHVNTPLEVCESLDRLGVYAGARNEKILSKFEDGERKRDSAPSFVVVFFKPICIDLPGVNGKFDPVTKADLVVDTSKQSVAQIIREIILLFEQDEFVGEK